ncbi:tumor necrosis factor receptor superfamily member 1A [Trichomycterus rosablanca]|uniref:tumor necrosis factor receptor superfamily member 1A n=1 Tax=Trichomycterus rosablanca TaxID=2290929 RepID=UPI002F35C02C
MDSRHQTGKCWRTFLPCSLFLLAFVSLTDSIPELNITNLPVRCKDNEYLSDSNQFCCDKCSPGYKLTKQCSGAGRRSQCDKCRNGTYMDGINYYRNCFRCQKCNKQNAVERMPCSHDQNTECGCEPGYYKKSIDDETWFCKRCRECGDGEMQISSCAWNSDTVCECKEDYYRKNSNVCIRCTNCSLKCTHRCPKTNDSILKTTTPGPAPGPVFPSVVMSVILVGIGLAGGIALYKGFKKGRRMFHKQSSKSHEAPDQERIVEMTQTYTCPPITVDETVPLSSPPNPGLPDCVPREIKTHEFIYFVLGLVPINRFKELVRHLNVCEQDIDRAERDHRAYADAQYQMLMVWIDGSTGGGKSVLSYSQLKQFVDVLRDMNLSACAESIEEKYCT